MIIIILVCVGFGTSFHLTNAYGLAGHSHLNSQTNRSCHGLNRHRCFARDGYALCLGLNFHRPNLLPLFLRSHRRCFLGL